MKLIIQTKHLIRDTNKNELNNEILVISDKDNIVIEKHQKMLIERHFNIDRLTEDNLQDSFIIIIQEENISEKLQIKKLILLQKINILFVKYLVKEIQY